MWWPVIRISRTQIYRLRRTHLGTKTHHIPWNRRSLPLYNPENDDGMAIACLPVHHFLLVTIVSADAADGMFTSGLNREKGDIAVGALFVLGGGRRAFWRSKSAGALEVCHC